MKIYEVNFEILRNGGKEVETETVWYRALDIKDVFDSAYREAHEYEKDLLSIRYAVSTREP